LELDPASAGSVVIADPGLQILIHDGKMTDESLDIYFDIFFKSLKK
jgi:hypothetical protein